MAIWPACSTMSVFIVAAIRNTAQQTASSVMTLNSAMTWSKKDRCGHTPWPRVAGSATNGSVPVSRFR
jgi:hypothetical protein